MDSSLSSMEQIKEGMEKALKQALLGTVHF